MLPEPYASLNLQQTLILDASSTPSRPLNVVLVKLNRPTKHNAFTDRMADELEQIFNLLDKDDRVRCIVLTGEGRSFCAGADLELGFESDGKGSAESHRDGGGRVALAINNCQKPTIAAINGNAVGVGLTMTLPASMRVVSKAAKIGFVFARRGIVMEAASSFFLPRLIGYSRALHLVTTGGVYPATHKLLDSLFSEVVEPSEVLPTAMRLAEEVATKTSVVSTALMRNMIWRGPDTPEGSQLLTSRLLFDLFQGKCVVPRVEPTALCNADADANRDMREGVASFMGKREADYKGKLPDDAPAAYPWWKAIDVSPPGKAKL